MSPANGNSSTSLSRSRLLELDDKVDHLLDILIGSSFTLSEALAHSDAVCDRRFSDAAQGIVDGLYQVKHIRGKIGPFMLSAALETVQ